MTREEAVQVNIMDFHKKKIIYTCVHAMFSLNLRIGKDKLALAKMILFLEPIALLFKEYVLIYSLVH